MIRIVLTLLSVLFFNLHLHAQAWQWGRGSKGNNINSWPVATDTFGNIFVAGVSSGPVSFDDYNPPFNTIGSRCVIAKYDACGNFVWARSTENAHNASLINIAADVNGNCYVLGWLPDSSLEIGGITLQNSVYPYAQYFVAKYDRLGDVIWASTAGGRFGSGSIPPVALGNEYAAKMMGLGAITADLSGNIYVTTSFNLPYTNAGPDTLVNKEPSGATDDIMLVKYDRSGNVVWAKSAGGSGDDIPCGVTVTAAGDIYIAGLFNSDSVVFGTSVIIDTSTAAQKWNAFIARYDASGNQVWANGSGGNGNAYAAGIASDANNNVYLTGGTAENNIFFSGTSITDSYPGKPILYLIKFNSLNQVDWYKTIGSPTGGGTWGYAASVSPNGEVWVAGAFTDEIKMDSYVVKAPPASVDPVFIASFSTSGTYIAAAALKSGASEQAGLACDRWGSVYLCASYEYPSYPFVIANDVLENVAPEEKWLYLAKYSFTGGGGNGGGVLPAGPDTLYNTVNISRCLEDSMALVGPHGYALYQWNDGSSDSLLQITSAGTYWVIAIGLENTVFFDTFNVKTDTRLCDCFAFLPDAFTPNDDGKNDDYGPIFENSCSISRYAFSIYNRWGQRVFYSDKPGAKWNGKFEGADAVIDVYMYYLQYSTGPNYPEHKRKGDVTLIR